MGNNKLSKKITDVLCYATRIGFLIAFLMGDRQKSKVHLNNGIFVMILEGIQTSMSYMNPVGFRYYVFLIIRAMYLGYMASGIYFAVIGEDRYLPLVKYLRVFR